MCIFFPFFYFEGGFYFRGGFWILDPGSGVVWGRRGRNKSRRGEGRRRQAGPTLGANCPSKCSALIFGFVSSLSLSLSRAFAVPRSSPRVQNHRRRLEIAPDSSETEPCFDTFLVLLRSFIDRAHIWDFIYSRNLILAFKNSPSTGDWD